MAGVVTAPAALSVAQLAATAPPTATTATAALAASVTGAKGRPCAWPLRSLHSLPLTRKEGWGQNLASWGGRAFASIAQR